MISWLERAWPWLICVFVLLVPSPAHASEKITKLAEQLRSSDDFRVRTQAALALGATKTRKAVEPLCAGLSDSNTSVRAAAAAALGKLKRGGLDCLGARLKKESSSSVKTVIKKSVKSIKKALGPPLGSKTEYYVALELKNTSEVSDSVVASKVRGGLLGVIKKRDGYSLAPEEETAEEAKKSLAKYPDVAGFLLLAKAKVSHAGGTMKVKLEISVFDYPNRALKGSFTVTVGFPDVEADDTGAQKELLTEAGRSAAEKFTENAARFK